MGGTLSNSQSFKEVCTETCLSGIGFPARRPNLSETFRLLDAFRIAMLQRHPRPQGQVVKSEGFGLSTSYSCWPLVAKYEPLPVLALLRQSFELSLASS